MSAADTIVVLSVGGSAAYLVAKHLRLQAELAAAAATIRPTSAAQRVVADVLHKGQDAASSIAGVVGGVFGGPSIEDQASSLRAQQAASEIAALSPSEQAQFYGQITPTARAVGSAVGALFLNNGHGAMA